MYRICPLIPGSSLAVSSPAVATDADWGMNRAAVTANCSFSSSPRAHLSPHLVVLHHSCFKHGRVNLHILQAASLPIYLSSCFPPLSPSLRQGCAVRLFQSGGVVTSDGWLSTFCCLPLRSWEIYRLADYQAWKPISLSHSFLPSSILASLAPSILLPLFLHLLSYPKNFHNQAICAKQCWNLWVDTGK